MDGKTKSGFNFHVEEKTFDNMELVDALAEMADDDSLAVAKVINLVLGIEQKKQLYDHVRTNDGRVPVSDISNEIKDIFEAFGSQGKNS